MELPEALKEKVYRAIAEHKLVGFVSYSDDEYQALLAYTKIHSRSFASGVGTFLRGDDKIHFITLVEIAKKWKSNDNGDEGFWQYVWSTLGVEDNPKLWRAYKELILGLGQSKKILLADTADKYYATLLMHACAPYNSMSAFFHFAYNIYKKDLDFTEPDHEICDIATEGFCAVAQGLGGKDVGVSIGSGVYGIQIGLRSMALGRETRNCFTELLEKVLRTMDLLYHKNPVPDDEYLIGLVKNWWAKKEDLDPIPSSAKHPIQPTSKQSISVKLIRRDSDVYLCVPPIRFARDEYPTIWLSVYTGNQPEPILSREIFTRTGEITVTSAQQDIKLNDLLKNESAIKIRVEITENQESIYDKIIERDFILFDNEKELTNRVLKAGNYFVYTLSIDTLQTPTAISTVTSNLYNIYPTEGEILGSEARQVIFTGDAETSIIATRVQLIGASGICQWMYGGRECKVFGSQINLLVPHSVSVNGLELRVDGNRTLLSDYTFVSDDGFYIYDITRSIPQHVPCELIVYSHLKERELIHADIVSIQKLRIAFTKSLYYYDEDRSVRVSVGEQYKDLSWQSGEETASCTLCKGRLEITIPQMKWRIDLGDWHYAPISGVVWYKDYFNNGSVLEVQSPIAIAATKLYCIGDGATQELPLNASSKFEVGKYIFANEGRRKFVFFLKLDESGERKELFEVTTVERFTQEPPFIVENGKLRFIGDKDFIGGKKSHFNICLKRIGRDEMTKKSTDLIDGILPDVDEGIYWIKVSSPSAGLFSSSEKVLWEGEFVFGDREKLKLSNLILKINPISGPNMGDSWKQLPIGYYVTNLVREQDSDSYLARLHYRNSRDEKTDVCGFSECRIVILSSIALQVYLKNSTGDYTSKFKCDERGNLYSPQSNEIRTATNYHFIEVKHV